MTNEATSFQRLALNAALVLFCMGLVYAMFYYIVYELDAPIGTDYLTTFRLATQDVLDGNGTELYTRGSWGYFNAPWLMLSFLPLELLSPDAAVVVWNGTMLLLILVSIHLFRVRYPTPNIAIVLVLVNLHTLDLFVRSQVEAIVLFGAVLAWWAVQERRPLWLGVAAAALAVKPLNVALFGVLLLYMIREWHWREKLLVVLPVIVLTLASMPIFGVDFPLRMVQFGIDTPPTEQLASTITITLWDISETTGIPSGLMVLVALVLVALFLWQMVQYKITVRTFALSIATMLVVTTYANSNHYVLLIPVYLLVASYDLRIALVAFAFTWTPLLRIWYADSISWVDISYPAILLVAVWVYIWQAQKNSHKAPILEPHEIH